METPLEVACKVTFKNTFDEMYQIYSNLLLLNYKLIKRNDERLSAKVTALLFAEGIEDKAHLICKILEDSELSIHYSKNDIDFTRRLLLKDPTLKATHKVIDQLKQVIYSKEMAIQLKVAVNKELDKYLLMERAKFIHTY